MASYNLPLPGSDTVPENSWEQQRVALTTTEEGRRHAQSHLAALAQQAGRELRSLLIRRSKVMKRLGDLRRVVRHLVELYGEPLLESPLTASAEPFSEEQFRNSPEKNTNTATAPDFGHLPFEPDRKRLHSEPALQRACRIALMEIDGPASAGDIYDRIVRRGSFQFRKTKRPLASVATALNSMVRKGEATNSHDTAWQCWQWNSHRSGNPELPDSRSSFQQL